MVYDLNGLKPIVAQGLQPLDHVVPYTSHLMYIYAFGATKGTLNGLMHLYTVDRMSMDILRYVGLTFITEAELSTCDVSLLWSPLIVAVTHCPPHASHAHL